uniref:IAP-3 n=1 Tax=Spodoptera frugiperda nuclear polyhedrosis virus TaxID=10455 RepID=A0A7G3W7G7_NPVSF|nr:IAP-3 [Spodoptera frugiperda multiple nucleopolyhedrovirus]
MQSFEDRLKTFSNWPANDRVPSHMLALAGFYYTGRNDEVRCAFCKVEIMKWKYGDNPILDHKKWAPQCKFAKLLISNPLTPITETGIDECGTSNNPVPKMIPKYPAYEDVEKRRQSYQNLPIPLYQDLDDMACAGFYYNRDDSTFVCFQGGCTIVHWERRDDPWREHARWFPNCEYVNYIKGRDFVQESISLSCVIQSNEQEQQQQQQDEQQQQYAVNNSVAVDKNKDDRDDKDDLLICKICFDNRRDVCFLPCGHVVSCRQCSSNVKHCPLCRSNFTSVHQLYYA